MLLLATSVGNAADEIAAKLAAVERRTGGRVGVALLDSTGRAIAEYRSRERFPMCSTFKLLAAAAVLRKVDDNRDTLGRFVRYTEADLLAYAPVTRAHLHEGGMRLGDLCAAAVEQSDNTAGNLLLDAIGGPAGLTKFARELNDEATTLTRREPELNSAKPGDDADTTTPFAMCGDLQRLLASDVLSPASRRLLNEWLEHCETGKTMIRAAAGEATHVGDKTGRNADGATNDVAVLQRADAAPVFLAIYTWAPALPAKDREVLVADVARAVLEVVRQ